MRQRLGQHFLQNKEKIQEIIKTLEIKDGDTIVEIGAGHGEITDELRIMNHELRIIAIEKDSFLAKRLNEKYKNNERIKVINADVLKILPSIIHNSSFLIQNYKIVGNIPYYITGQLLRILSKIEPKPKICVFTVQKEVAERICAKPHTRTSSVRGRPPGMNLLAAAVQFWAEPEIIDFISKKDFYPLSKVDSAIIALRTLINADNQLIDTDAYYKLIKILFKQPRKTVLNNLIGLDKSKRSYYEGLLKKIGVNPNDRPQNLDLETIKKLAKMLYNS